MRRKILKWILGIAGALPALLVIAVVAGWLWLRTSLPETEGQVHIAGLEAPVEVLRDGDGVVTIRASSMADGYAALGFVHAQDRLAQMELMRRVVAGRTSEIAGAATIGMDRFFRGLDFDGLAAANWDHLSPETRAAVESYTGGVNAYLENHEGAWPPELAALRLDPAPWRPTDSLLWGRLMALQLSSNWHSEILRARLNEKLGAARAGFFFPDHPNDLPTIEPEAATALSDMDLGDLTGLLPWAYAPKSASNSWALAGRHTESGLPFVANDPHLGLNAPGHWYLVRIETPERTIAGVTAPGVPFHVIGHNGKVAWGFTTTHSDTQDLFIEKVTGQDGDRYVTPDGPEPFETREVEIAVRGEDEPRRLTLRRSRHGPVLSDFSDNAAEAAEAGHVLALAWPALRRDDRTADALRLMNEAGDGAELVEATRLFQSPQQNIIYADTAGAIGLIAPARVPIRKKGDGRVPVPGWTGEYGWQGFVPFEELPRIENPADGRIVSANNRLVGDDYPYLITADWPPPYRANLVRERLDALSGPVALDAMTRLQTDAYATDAARHLPGMLAVLPEPDTALARAARGKLAAWDFVMDRRRAEPLIYMAWLGETHRRLFADQLGETLYAELRGRDPLLVARALAGQGGWCDDAATADTTETCAEIAHASLEAAVGRLARRYGSDLEKWRWGEAHVATFPHPIFSRVPLIRDLWGFSVGTDGGDETLNRGGVAWSGDHPFGHRHGATMRVVFDLADLDRSRFMLATGQSGNPLSPHYGSLAKRWRDGVFLKLVGDTKAETRRLTLNPR